MTRALLLIGAPGSGKSSTLQALSSELERAQVPHSTLESEQLSMGWPLLPATTWIPSLASVLQAQLAAGRDLFLIAATPESPSDLAQIQTAIPTERLATICLSAPPTLVASRITTREPDTWPGKPHLILHARHLATEIPTFPGITTTISTSDTAPTAIATSLIDTFLRVPDLSEALGLADEPQDWGIVNADATRLEEFATFLAERMLTSTQVFMLMELLLASANDRLLEDPHTDLTSITTALHDHPAAGALNYDYWSNLNDPTLYPIAPWLRAHPRPAE
jgi:hypothetical protein